MRLIACRSFDAFLRPHSDPMTSVVVIGSCLTNLSSVPIQDYKWNRLNNASVLRSDHFVRQFLDQEGGMPSREEFRALIRWKPEDEKQGELWLSECYRDRVGHFETPPDEPGLFETLERKQVDVILMDNLCELHTVLLHRRAQPGAVAYSLLFSMSRCENELKLAQDFYYGQPLDAAESVASWVRIVRYVRENQSCATILFYCAHDCTSVDVPERYGRATNFSKLLVSLASELGITIIPPLNLPSELTRMPEDRDHLEWKVYRAMAGQMFLMHATRGAG
jgi:hypothetical protein